jgi:1-deoxy-D-xylulose-5-phosphate synthase
MHSALATALKMNSPVAVRYPRGECPFIAGDDGQGVIQPGRGAVLRGSLTNEEAAPLAVVAVGGAVYTVCCAVDALRAEDGIRAAVFDPLWLKPLPHDDLLALAANYPKLLVVEEHALSCGFGSAVLELLNERGFPGSCRVHRHGLPDNFIEYGKAAQLRALFRLDVAGLKQVILDVLR